MTAAPLLVTGANGWLGSRLVEVLVNGLADVESLAEPDHQRPIRCLDLNGQGLAELSRLSHRVSVFATDITRPDSLVPFFKDAAGATLFNCAGLIHPTRISQLFAVNVDGTENLLSAAVEAGVRRFIHVSSNSPIGTNADRESLFDESSPYNPYMGYGRSKKLAEEVVNRFAGEGRIETVIIRPPWFYGPRQPARQALFLRMIRDGRAPVVGDGDNRRSMAYVDNICQGLLLCEQVSKAAGKTYWIADRRPYTVNEIIDTVETVLERDFGIEVVHRRLRLPSLASELALVADRLIQGVGLYQQKIHVLSEMNKNIACSIARAEEELGYDPKVALEEGMRRSIRWALDNGQPL
jgi:nucleoside-diphosphate-sugar epimerase